MRKLPRTRPSGSGMGPVRRPVPAPRGMAKQALDRLDCSEDMDTVSGAFKIHIIHSAKEIAIEERLRRKRGSLTPCIVFMGVGITTLAAMVALNL